MRYVCFRADANEYWKLLCNSVLQEGSLRNGFLPTSVPFGVGRRHWCNWSPSSSAGPSYPIAQPCAWLSCGRETNGSLWVSSPQGHLLRTLSHVETKKKWEGHRTAPGPRAPACDCVRARLEELMALLYSLPG